jgi:hypothetical protein
MPFIGFPPFVFDVLSNAHCLVIAIVSLFLDVLVVLPLLTFVNAFLEKFSNGLSGVAPF